MSNGHHLGVWKKRASLTFCKVGRANEHWWQRLMQVADGDLELLCRRPGQDISTKIYLQSVLSIDLC